MDDENDPIVKRIPLILNRLADTKSYLLQYPLRPNYRPYGDHGQLDKVSIGSQEGGLRLTYKLNTLGEYYNANLKKDVDNFESELRANNKLSDSDMLYYKFLSYQVLSSEKSTNSSTLSMGIYKNGFIYICPITEAFQLKPDFKSLDDRTIYAEKNKNNAMKPQDNDQNVLDSKLEFTDSISDRINISNAQKRAIEKNQDYRQISNLYESDSIEAFEIRDLLTTVENMHEPKSIDEADDFLQKSKKNFENNITKLFFDNDKEAYLNAICADCATHEETKFSILDPNKHSYGANTGLLSYVALSKLTVEDQILRIFVIRGSTTLKDVKNLITDPSLCDKYLVDIMIKYAIFINGIWFCRSEFCVGESQDWDNMMLLTRDLILCLFARKKAINKVKIQQITKISMYKLNVVLKNLFNNIDGKYEPKTSIDEIINQNFSDLVMNFANEWTENKAKEILDKLTVLNQEKAQFENEVSKGKMKIDNYIGTKKTEQIILDLLYSHGGLESSVILVLLIKNLKETCEKQTNDELLSSTTQLERQKILSNHNKIIEALDELKIDNLEIFLNSIALKFHNLWLPKKPFAPEFTNYRTILFKLIEETIETGFKKADFNQRCLDVLGKQCQLADSQMRKLFQEICINRNGTWYFKNSENVKKQF